MVPVVLSDLHQRLYLNTVLLACGSHVQEGLCFALYEGCISPFLFKGRKCQELLEIRLMPARPKIRFQFALCVVLLAAELLIYLGCASEIKTSIPHICMLTLAFQPYRTLLL